jgi:phosphoglycolate phosphatase
VKLVLFDIDGTILWTDGAGRRAIHDALRDVFGGIGPAGYWFDGKTDRQIVRELMRHDGHDDAVIDSRMERLLDGYVENLRRELRDPAHPPRLLPGVNELLDAVERHPQLRLGLLTGNLFEGAAAKLESVGIDPARFAVGAFGSDHEHRPSLPAVALERAREALGLDLRGESLVIVGDTPADVQCGRPIGARAVAVATGRYSVDDLRAHDPVAVFEDLSDTDAVIRAIENA